jgi:catechol 2,3-dioxygenase-like lactoylglutathione lyase family enzyme
MTSLRRVARNVANLENAQAFYVKALGFSSIGKIVEDIELAKVLGISRARSARMKLGAQQIELTECSPQGAVYPIASRADDPFFQHIALVTTDIFTACARATQAGAVPISSHGPQRLPIASGGGIYWKFRDPEGHPLEFMQLPEGAGWHGDALLLGYDHSAIAVAEAERAIAFYTGLGLEMRHRQTNCGPEQDRLDGFDNVTVDVVAMAPRTVPPHVELLGYRSLRERPRIDMRPNDIAADRLVFSSPHDTLSLTQDPDGHFLLLDGRE